jgi:hypothetical protein
MTIRNVSIVGFRAAIIGLCVAQCVLICYWRFTALIADEQRPFQNRLTVFNINQVHRQPWQSGLSSDIVGRFIFLVRLAPCVVVDDDVLHAH